MAIDEHQEFQAALIIRAPNLETKVQKTEFWATMRERGCMSTEKFCVAH